jgi:hypothetical protein
MRGCPRGNTPGNAKVSTAKFFVLMEKVEGWELSVLALGYEGGLARQVSRNLEQVSPHVKCGLDRLVGIGTFPLERNAG